MTILEQKQAAAGIKVAAARAEAQSLDIWKYNHLKLLGHATDRATLRRWIDRHGFPQPIVLSGDSIAWVADEVRAWFANRPRGAAPQPRRYKPRAEATAA